MVLKLRTKVLDVGKEKHVNFAELAIAMVWGVEYP